MPKPAGWTFWNPPSLEAQKAAINGSPGTVGSGPPDVPADSTADLAWAAWTNREALATGMCCDWGPVALRKVHVP